MIFTDTEAIAKVTELAKQTPTWVVEARENSRVYKALVNGDNFLDVLINKIEHIESENKAKARKKYSKDIRDLFERVMKPRENVFQSNGGSEKILIKNDSLKEAFIKAQSNFKSNKSVFKYLSEVYFNLCDIDPNGVIFLEYGSKGVYPTYKGMCDIMDYEANGQKLEYIVFTPDEDVRENETEDNTKRYWRIVDDAKDRIILEVKGAFEIVTSDTFTHPFGETPGLILSEREKVGSNIRITNIEKIIELSKSFARDKSILEIYKFQKGFPTHWRLVMQCKKCTGIGKDDSGNKCTSCDGHGYARNNDVTDMVTIPIPDIDQPKVTPDVAGFVSPDLETWKQYKEDLVDLEKVMKDTVWGTNLYTSRNPNLTETETATGRHIDVQPIINALNSYSDTVEYVDNTLCNWIINFIDQTKRRDDILYAKTYGRRFIIESPDIILLKYQEAKKTSDSSTVLDKLLEEFILSKYKNDHAMQNLMLKKKDLEPYVHLSFDQVNLSFGAEEALKKELFNKFWSTCNIDSPKEVLIREFDSYVSDKLPSYKIEKPAPAKVQ